MLLPAASPLPALGCRGFSLVSLNVLLPNSVDGWWIYKMYGPGVPEAATTWTARQSLLKDLLLRADADILTLQETSAESFESDFSFLFEAGYDCALHAKGRMRPATFWKRGRFCLCQANGTPLVMAAAPAPAAVPATAPAPAAAPVTAPAAEAEGSPREEAPSGLDAFTTASSLIHGDRTLTVPLAALDESGSVLASVPPLNVVNCHLSAGQEARRRLRQVHDALEAIRKAQDKASGGAGGAKGGKGGKKGGKAEPAAEAMSAVVVCGDFNSQGSTAVRQLLCAGEVLPDFRESGDPTELRQQENEVTSKPKRHKLGAFFDAAAAAFGEADGVSPPPSLICPTLQPKMAREDTDEPTEGLLQALGGMFAKLSADGETMTAPEQEHWLTLVNKKVGRGDEYRNAAKARLARGEDVTDLTKRDFEWIYAQELSNGKFWGIEHDLRVVTGTGLATAGEPPFTARFDYAYATSASLRLHGAQPPLSTEQMTALLEGRAQVPSVAARVSLLWCPLRSGR